MKGYKGFDHGMVCRGKKYAENAVFEEDTAKICKKGMHFCENPFDVLNYYGFVNDSGEFNEFAEVESLEDTQTDDGRKFCTTKLKVGAKLSFGGFVKACVGFILEKTKSNPDDNDISDNGYTAQIGSSGDNAQIGSSGYAAQIGSSGDNAKIGSSGNDARIGSCGDNACINSTGEVSVICCAGHGSSVKAKKGSWITLSEWGIDNKGNTVPVCVKTEYVDGVRIKEGVPYKLVNGEFVEVNSNA